MEPCEQGGDMGVSREVVNQASRSVLYELQGSGGRCWESSEEGVAVVQAGEDQRLDQELR